MVEINQVYEAAPSDIEDDEQSRKSRGFGSKAALTVASGIAMASGMFMGNQMLVPAIVGASANPGANVLTQGNSGDAANAAELGSGSRASGVSFGSANEDNSVFAIAAGKAFGKTAFGASAEVLAAAAASAGGTITPAGTIQTTTTISTTTATAPDPATTTAPAVDLLPPPPAFDTGATNTSSATTVAGGTGTGSGTGAGGTGSGHYEDHDGDHEDHEDDDDD